MRIASALLVGCFVAVTSVAVRAADDDRACSVATLDGGYGFSFTGSAHTAAGQSPRGGVGRWMMDGRGTFFGTVTIVADGVVVRRPLVGTYLVEPDCTGSATVTFTDAADGQASFDIVIENGGRDFQAVATPPPGAPPLTQVALFKKQARRR